MLMSASSTSNSYGNVHFAVQEVEGNEDMGELDESKQKQCYYYKISLYAALLAIFMMLSLVFILLYSRCHITFGELYQGHLLLNSKLCDNCHENAYCQVRKYNNQSRCICDDLHVGDGRTYCHALSFATRFSDNTRDYPSTNVKLPESRDVSFCTWLSLESIPSTKMTIFSYVADDSTHTYKFYVIPNGVELTRNSEEINITLPLTENYWNHFCSIWRSNGLVQFYINGNGYKKRFSVDPLPNTYNTNALSNSKSTGKFILGKTDDGEANAFRGSLSQFFMYNRSLTKNDISNLFRYEVSIYGLVVSWHDFKKDINSTNCDKPRYVIFPDQS